MSTLSEQVLQLITEQPDLITIEIAETLKQPEGAIIKALPADQSITVEGSFAEKILSLLPTWGDLAVIVNKEDSLFEYKGKFPKAVTQRGYFNLNLGPESDSNIQFSGHLKLERINAISFVSRSFRRKESYCIVFISDNDEVVFKVYLGRDDRRHLFPEQIEVFKALAQELSL